MSTLRQRFFGSSMAGILQKKDEVRPTPVPKIATSEPVKRRFIFILGGLFGILIAVFFVDRTEIVDFGQLSYKNLDLDSLVDILPAAMLKDARAMSVGFV